MLKISCSVVLVLEFTSQHVRDVLCVDLAVFNGDQFKEVLDVLFRIFLSKCCECGLDAAGMMFYLSCYNIIY